MEDAQLKHFNPRTREGCDLFSLLFTLIRFQISIHAPVKGATCCGPPHFYAARFFNPRTREGCDGPGVCKKRSRFAFSIHAPVKGATLVFYPLFIIISSFSIHAPVKGATELIRQQRWSRLFFNPRTREGCDYYTSLAWLSQPNFQSTHP